jgi:hypothetical protein
MESVDQLDRAKADESTSGPSVPGPGALSGSGIGCLSTAACLDGSPQAIKLEKHCGQHKQGDQAGSVEGDMKMQASTLGDGQRRRQFAEQQAKAEANRRRADAERVRQAEVQRRLQAGEDIETLRIGLRVPVGLVEVELIPGCRLHYPGGSRSRSRS